MAAEIEQQGMSIKTVEFDVTLENLNEFKEYWTEKFYICGNPWAIHFYKFDSEEDGVKISYLAGFLHSKKDTPLKDWAIVANFTLEIFSYGDESTLRVATPCVFLYRNTSGWGFSEFIEWDELMDPERGYVYDGKCKIGINVKASPLQFPNDGKFLEFVPIMKCCDATSSGEFRIKVKEFYNFFDICTPKFFLKHFPWRLVVYKNVTLENGNKNEFLRIELFNRSIKNAKLSCKVTLECKLVPFDTAIEPTSNKFENKEISCSRNYFDLNIISWKELMNPQNKFIQNNSFVLEIKMEVTETTEQQSARALKRAANDKNKQGFIRLECPICFQWVD